MKQIETFIVTVICLSWEYPYRMHLRNVSPKSKEGRRIESRGAQLFPLLFFFKE